MVNEVKSHIDELAIRRCLKSQKWFHGHVLKVATEYVNHVGGHLSTPNKDSLLEYEFDENHTVFSLNPKVYCLSISSNLDIPRNSFKEISFTPTATQIEKKEEFVYVSWKTYNHGDIDHDFCKFPISYLWMTGWKALETKRMDAEAKKKLKEEYIASDEYKEKIDKEQRATYEILKKKFENNP